MKSHEDDERPQPRHGATAAQDTLVREGTRAERGLAWLRLLAAVSFLGVDASIILGPVAPSLRIPTTVLWLEAAFVLVALGAALWLRGVRTVTDRHRYALLSVDLAFVGGYALTLGEGGVLDPALSSGAAAGLSALILLMSVLRFSLRASLFGAGLACAVVLGVSLLLHTPPEMLVAAFAMAALTGGMGALASWRYRQAVGRAVERSRFERFLPREVVDEVIAGQDEVALGGREVVATILFSDLAGFTTMSEKMSPAEVVEMLNRYLDPVVDVIFRHLGTLDKFVGDAVMAVFGAPMQRDDDAHRAVRCALDMRRAVAALNRRREAEGLPPLVAGVGLHTGSVVAGTIGSARRMEYTVIGDAVNVASRVEGLTRRFGEDILLTRSTADAVQGAFRLRRVGEVQVKGRVEPVEVFAVDGPAD